MALKGRHHLWSLQTSWCRTVVWCFIVVGILGKRHVLCVCVPLSDPDRFFSPLKRTKAYSVRDVWACLKAWDRSLYFCPKWFGMTFIPFSSYIRNTENLHSIPSWYETEILSCPWWLLSIVALILPTNSRIHFYFHRNVQSEFSELLYLRTSIRLTQQFPNLRLTRKYSEVFDLELLMRCQTV